MTTDKGASRRSELVQVLDRGEGQVEVAIADRGARQDAFAATLSVVGRRSSSVGGRGRSCCTSGGSGQTTTADQAGTAAARGGRGGRWEEEQAGVRGERCGVKGERRQTMPEDGGSLCSDRLPALLASAIRQLREPASDCATPLDAESSAVSRQWAGATQSKNTGHGGRRRLAEQCSRNASKYKYLLGTNAYNRRGFSPTQDRYRDRC